MFRPLLLSAVAAGLMLGAAGCKHKCCRSVASPYPPRPFLPAGPSNIPPAGVPVTPPSGGSVFPPPGSSLPPPDLSVPAPAPGNGGRPSPELILPDPLPGGTSRSSYAAPANTAILGPPVKPPAGSTPEPPVASTPTSAATTAGLPGFARIEDGIATGRRPALDGFDSLKRQGYRHVVYLHAAGTDASATREVAEGRGLTFTAIETTPEKIAEAYDTFKKAIADKPVYVFDDDGLRTGAMWYLYFRLVDLESADVGKIRARALGLKEEGDEAQAFWIAMQKFLAAR